MDFFRKTLNLGIRSNQSFSQQKRIRLLNLVCLSGAFSFLCLIPVGFIAQDNTALHLTNNLISLLVCVVGLYFNAKGRYAFARLLSFSFFALLILSMVLMYGIGAGTQIYIFPLLVTSIVLFETKREIALSFILNLLILLGGVYFSMHYTPFADDPQAIKYFIIPNHVISFVLLFAAIYFFKAEHLSYEKEIESKNEELQSQQETIGLKNLELQKKNKTILDSILYASRIQQAILPPSDELAAVFEEHFVYFKSKDIVSGDFYWLERYAQDGQDLVFVAVADCTGHGVPGCLMSMIGANSLQQIVMELKIHSPNAILLELDAKVKNLLKQKGKESNEIRDGMDIALAVYDRKAEKLLLASAERPIYFFRKGELNEFKGDKYPIGSGFYKEKSFTLKEIALEKGDVFYFFTDGITDQFDSSNRKKYGPKQLRERLSAMQNYALAEQKMYLDSEFANWQGRTPQTDDQLMIAFRPI